MMENMKYYEMGRSVPQDALKNFNNGRFSGTDINPMWRIKKLTEMFGPAGIGWYTEVTRQDTIEADEGNMMVFVDVNLYVKTEEGWSKPIFGTGGNTLKAKGKGDDDGFKKAYTDALSIACKALGIGADVWYANDTTSKYSDKYTDAPRGSKEAAQEAGNAKLEEINRKLAEAGKQAAQGATGAFTCERCGKPIKAVRFGDGTTMKVSEILDTTRKDLDANYCYKCYMDVMEAKDGTGN